MHKISIINQEYNLFFPNKSYAYKITLRYKITLHNFKNLKEESKKRQLDLFKSRDRQSKSYHFNLIG